MYKTRSTEHIALPSEEERATAIGNMCRKFGHMVFKMCERTDREDTLIAIFRQSTGSEVKKLSAEDLSA